MKKITLELVKSFNPCYDPEEIGLISDMKLTPLEVIEQVVNKVKSKDDIIWLLCRKEFMSDKDMRFFAVWCAREALKLVENPDQRSINACDVAEKYANGKATKEELAAARAAAKAAAMAAASAAAKAAAMAAASDAAMAAAWAAASDAAMAAARAAARAAASAAAKAAASAAQLNKLKEYFV